MVDDELLSSELSPETLALLQMHIKEHGVRQSESDSNSGDDEDDTNNITSASANRDNLSASRSSTDGIPKDNHVYKRQEYWDERFDGEEKYDWLVTYADVKGLLAQHIPSHDSHILMVGCGNSTFSEDMYNAGYKNITNIDFSGVVIDKMAEQHADKPEMKWLTRDMLKLHHEPGTGADAGFPADSFDVVLDKAAMDALMCDEGDVWNPERHVVTGVHRMCTGIRHVLRPTTGTFIQISFAQPHFRRRYLLGEHLARLVREEGEVAVASSLEAESLSQPSGSGGVVGDVEAQGERLLGDVGDKVPSVSTENAVEGEPVGGIAVQHDYGWQCDTCSIDKGLGYFFYVMTQPQQQQQTVAAE